MSGKHAKEKITLSGRHAKEKATLGLHERIARRMTGKELGRRALRLGMDTDRSAGDNASNRGVSTYRIPSSGQHAIHAPYTLRRALGEARDSLIHPAAGKHARREKVQRVPSAETISFRESMRKSRVGRRVGRLALTLGLTLGIAGGTQALDSIKSTTNVAVGAPGHTEAGKKSHESLSEQSAVSRTHREKQPEVAPSETKAPEASPTPKAQYEANSLLSLPDKTISFLQQHDLEERFKANESRYEYAEKETGVPKHALAAIHYREAGPSMPADVTLLDGEPLNKGSNSVDGHYINPDAEKDAVNAANLFKDLAEEVYDVDVTKDDLSPEEWTEAFTAYNRGNLYEKAGVSPDQSPYALNGIDEEHQDMHWPGGEADPGRSTRGGGKDGNPVGAVPAMIYFEKLSKDSENKEGREVAETTETVQATSNE